MANTTPTRVPFFRGIWLCLLLLFAPRNFKLAQDADNLLLNAGDSGDDEDMRHVAVRRAFMSSFLLVVASSVVGYGAARLALVLGACSSDQAIAWLQVAGACFLLWGTLFVRGWDIQTIGGVSLTERVNHWLYRALYCLGTAVIVFSLAWSGCRVAG